MEVQTIYTQDEEETLKDMLATSHASAINGIKVKLKSYLQIIVTGMPLGKTVDGLFIWNLEWWSQILELMDALRQKVLISKTPTNSLAIFSKQRVAITVDEWRLKAFEERHDKKKKRQTVPWKSLLEASTSEDL